MQLESINAKTRAHKILDNLSENFEVIFRKFDFDASSIKYKYVEILSKYLKCHTKS